MESPPPSSTSSPAAEAILHSLIPRLLLRSRTVVFFPGRWRALREDLEHLRRSLSEAMACSGCLSQPLFLDLLPPLLTSLRALLSLSDRCHDRGLPRGKLLLQSDLAMAAASLSLRSADLDLLLRSELLLQPRVSSADLVLFVRDLFARLRIGGWGARKKAIESLVGLFAGAGEVGGAMAAELGALVAGEGDVAALVRLMEANCELAAEAVCFLAMASEVSRTAVFEEGGLGALLRLLELGPPSSMAKPAMAIEAITADSRNSWAVQAHGGVPVLLQACARSPHPKTRSAIAGSLRNLAAYVLDQRPVMAEEGAIPILLELIREEDAREKAVQCLSFLSDSDGERVIRDGGLRELLRLFLETSSSSSAMVEQVLGSILALSSSPSAMDALSCAFSSSSSPWVLRLREMVAGGSPGLQKLGAGLIVKVAVSEEAKRAMAGAMAGLVRMMELQKPAMAKETAAAALISLLSSRSNQREMARDGESLGRVVELLKPAMGGVEKELVVAVVAAMAGGGAGCRRRLVESGACGYLQKLAEMEVAGARKALQRVQGGGFRRSLFSLPRRSFRDL
ncbi:ARM repeat superfamily protein [Wolffia australiana]